MNSIVSGSETDIAFSHWLALVLCVCANIAANVAFKSVMVDGARPLSLDGAIDLALDPRLWLGLLCAGLVLLSYLYAIRGVPLGIAYPAATGLAMVGMTAAGAALFGDAIGLRQIVALMLIVSGVTILVRA